MTLRHRLSLACDRTNPSISLKGQPPTCSALRNSSKLACTNPTSPGDFSTIRPCVSALTERISSAAAAAATASRVGVLWRAQKRPENTRAARCGMPAPPDSSRIAKGETCNRRPTLLWIGGVPEARISIASGCRSTVWMNLQQNSYELVVDVTSGARKCLTSKREGHEADEQQRNCCQCAEVVVARELCAESKSTELPSDMPSAICDAAYRSNQRPAIAAC